MTSLEQRKRLQEAVALKRAYSIKAMNGSGHPDGPRKTRRGQVAYERQLPEKLRLHTIRDGIYVQKTEGRAIQLKKLATKKLQKNGTNK